MYYNKYPQPANFQFLSSYRPGTTLALAKARLKFAVEAFNDDVYRITVTSPLWPRNFSQAGLTPGRPLKSGQGKTTTLTLDRGVGVQLRDAQGRILLSSPSRSTFGLCGKASIFMFHAAEGDQFYGMGEKWLGLELSNKRTKFWNTDAYGDFHPWVCANGNADPLYVSIPYMILKRGNTYVGLLMDNPCATFMSTTKEQSRDGRKTDCFTIGGEDGQPVLYILVGPTLPELTRKLQRLVGKTPRPPAWALGYHQCRWGYESAKDLEWLDREFRKHGIPCDGLWLDIGYMNGFRVFTFNRKNFPNPKRTFAELRKHGRRVVPIIDPGVKFEKGYPVYESARKAGALCRNPQGIEYVGMVWPGETAFPDFSTTRGRRWWAQQVKAFADLGLSGAWLDMNDPSTGSVDNMAMLFNDGRESHDTFHNQYALGMAVGSREGFLASHPDERPFLLSRSGFLGSSRHTAIWTGDNTSNYHHLKTGIACTLNLALSGIPFNAMDIGGFAGDTTAPLIRDWMKACFLFPVCRNHTSYGTRRQEPWAFDRKTLTVLRHYIRLRYRFRPYLYNLFLQQEASGEAILRPLFYDFADTRDRRLGTIDDQFMVGPSIMQAPFILEGQTQRDIVLPGKNRWYAAHEGRWIAGGRRFNEKVGAATTPFFVREGAILPLAPEAGANAAYDGSRVEFHVFLSAGSKTGASVDYGWDDGISFAYRNGRQSQLRVSAAVRGGRLEIRTELLKNGFGRCRPVFFLYDKFPHVTIDGKAVAVPKRVQWELAGTAQTAYRVG